MSVESPECSGEFPQLPRTLTVPQVADELQCSKRTVFNLISTKQLHSIKVGRSRRIPRESLNDYISRQLVQEPS